MFLEHFTSVGKLNSAGLVSDELDLNFPERFEYGPFSAADGIEKTCWWSCCRIRGNTSNIDQVPGMC